MQVLVNIDVDDLAKAVRFYEQALGLTLKRHLFDGTVAELAGASSSIFLLLKGRGTRAGGGQPRDYARHWTPVHVDFVVTDIIAARDRALAAGACAEGGITTAEWGKLALMSDPFGHGFCLVQFSGSGYDAVETPGKA